MTPSIGRIVTTPADSALNNGSSEAPAVITRVFGLREDGGWTVNLRQILDGNDMPWRTSQILYADEATARATGNSGIAWWPARV